MSIHIKDLDKERWIHDVFPEWGTWLNEEIDDTVVEENTLAMWWLGCTGIWLKTPGDANFVTDLWVGRGKSARHTWSFPYGQGKDFQMTRMTGSQQIQPNTRNVPMVIMIMVPVRTVVRKRMPVFLNRLRIWHLNLLKTLFLISGSRFFISPVLKHILLFLKQNPYAG